MASTGRVFAGAGSTSGLTQAQVDARVAALATGLTQAQTDARIALLAPSDWKGVAANQAARLAMAGLVLGDEVYQQDTKQAFMLVALPATAPSSWVTISAPDALVGATDALPGVAGYPSAPAAGTQDLVLRADATWSSPAPDWVASHAYSAGAVVVAENSTWRRIAAGTSGATFAAERASWLRIGGAELSRLIDVTPAPVPLTLAELTTFRPPAGKPLDVGWYAVINAGQSFQACQVINGAWTYVGGVPNQLRDVTPALIPPDLTALQFQVDATTQPAYERWQALTGVAPDYRTAVVVAGSWAYADSGDQSAMGAVPDDVVVDVTPAVRPTTLAALELAVPAATQQAGQQWLALLQPAPGVIRQARILNGAWAFVDSAGGGGSGVPMAGATAALPGTGGTVTAPLAGEHDLVLHGDGSWAQVAPDWVAARAYSAGALVVNGGVLYRRVTAGTSAASFAADTANWLALGSAAAGGPRVHLTNTAVAPALAGAPTLPEITARIGANRNTILYYTGTDTATDLATYVYHVDSAGALTLLRSPATAAGAMTGATATVVGTSGPAPAPPIGSQDLPLHGDATFKSVAPDWVASRAYSAGALVVNGGVLWRRVGAGTSGTTFDVTEQAAWLRLGSVMSGATSAAPGVGGTVPAPVAAQQDLFLAGDASYRGVAPDWVPVRAYSAGALVVQAGRLFRRIAAGSSGAVFDAAEQAAWTQLGAGPMVGASSSAAGAAGAVPAPVANQQDLFVRGDGTWSQVAPDWAPGRAYSAGALVFSAPGIYRRNTAGTSGAAFNAAEQLQWTLVADAVAGAVTFKGGWDPASGVFPGAGAAQAGWFYIASASGTVNGVTFQTGDSLYATVNNAVAAAYAGNWLRVPGGHVQPYLDGFTAAEWVLNGTDRELSYPVSVHLQGSDPFVQVTETVGANQQFIGVQTIVAPNGDVTVRVPDGGQVTGEIRISSGMGGPLDPGVGASLNGVTPGSSGLVAAPVAGDGRQVLRGDYSWGSNIPAWEPSVFYRAGYCILQGGAIWSRNTAGLSGAAFNVGEQASWTQVSQGTASTAVTVSSKAASYTTDDTDFGGYLRFTGGVPTLHSPAVGRIGQSITIRNATAAQFTVGVGTATVSGSRVVNADQVLVLLCVGAGAFDAIGGA